MFPIISILCHFFVTITATFQTDSEVYLPQAILQQGQLVTRESFTPQNKSSWTQIECSGEPEMIEENKNAIVERYRWYKTENGHYAIPVYINPEYDSNAVNKIIEGMYTIQESFCIQFYLYQDPDLLKGFNWVHVRKDRGCYSYIGRRKENQTLSLVDSCLVHPTIIHEFLHAIGLTHEQKRIDRDDHIIVHWENIIPGKESNFVKLDPNFFTSYDAPYDTRSLMHYSEKAFSKNGLPTLESKHGLPLGRSTEMTHWDIYKINKLYTCVNVNIK